MINNQDHDDENTPTIPEEPIPDEKDDSILNQIKKMCGIHKDDSSFDPDIIANINSALFTLTQIGIGPKKGFQIVDNKSTFSNFLGADNPRQGAVEQYLYIETKLGFDFPSSTAMAEQLKSKAAELEFRLMVSQDEPYQSELGKEEEIEEGGEISK